MINEGLICLMALLNIVTNTEYLHDNFPLFYMLMGKNILNTGF